MKNILLPTDFSQEATAASNLAIEFAEKFGSKIHLIHIMAIPIDWPLTNDDAKLYPDITKKVNEVTRKLNALKDQISSGGIDCNSLILFNETQEGISVFAQENQVDLIIMGSKGTSGLKGLIVGSNTEKAIRYAKCPVLVVKQPVLLSAIKNIVLVSDLNYKQEKIALMAEDWTRKLGAKLTIVKLNTHYRWVDSLKLEEEIKSFAAEFNIKNYAPKVIDCDYLEDGVIMAAEKLNADLIIMGTHQRTGIAHIIAGSIAENVANDSGRLILTIGI